MLALVINVRWLFVNPEKNVHNSTHVSMHVCVNIQYVYAHIRAVHLCIWNKGSFFLSVNNLNGMFLRRTGKEREKKGTFLFATPTRVHTSELLINPEDLPTDLSSKLLLPLLHVLFSLEESFSFSLPPSRNIHTRRPKVFDQRRRRWWEGLYNQFQVTRKVGAPSVDTTRVG